MREVEGKVAFITGGSSGIGRGIAIAFARAGMQVVISGRRREHIDESLAQFAELGLDVAAVELDVTDADSVSRAVTVAAKDLGPIDVVVNNAAVPKRRDVRKLTPDEVETVMAINYFAPVRITLALLPRMLERGDARIINICSIGGRIPVPHLSAYCASKFALCGWSEAMAIDLAKTNVRVVLINPGAVDTDIWDRPGSDAPVYDGPKVAPEEVAPGIVAAIDATNTESQAFEHYIPDMKAVVEWKTSNIDEFLSSVALMDTT